MIRTKYQNEREDETVLLQTGKYLSFELASNKYALHIINIREIVDCSEFINVPTMPECVMGLINLRGKIFPVIDLKAKLNIKDTLNTNQSCIIIVEQSYKEQSIHIGFLVDNVLEIIEITNQDINNNDRENDEYSNIRSIMKDGEAFKIIRKIEEIVSCEDFIEINKLLERIKEN